MQTNNKSSKKWVYKYYPMLGKVIIAVFLLMVKQVQVNLIPWLVMEPIKVLYQSLAKKFLPESKRIKIPINNMK